MKKSPLVVFLLCFTQMLLAQDLYVGSDSYLTIETGSSLAINGLVLSPTADYTVNSNTSISRLSTAANTGNISILRQYTFSQALTNYVGALLFHYEEAELNGVEAFELVLELFGTDALWHPFEASIDTNANTLAYTFNTGVDFSIVTTDNTETLDLESPEFMNQFVIYPNPTSDVVHIKYLNRVAINTTASANGGSDFALNYYWSSTEYGVNTAWSQYFYGGYQDTNYKYFAYNVRAVRAF